jgi:hypothetical protein
MQFRGLDILPRYDDMLLLQLKRAISERKDRLDRVHPGDVLREELRSLSLPELESQLVQAVESLDAGKGRRGGDVLRRLRKRMLPRW